MSDLLKRGCRKLTSYINAEHDGVNDQDDFAASHTQQFKKHSLMWLTEYNSLRIILTTILLNNRYWKEMLLRTQNLRFLSSS